LLSSSHSQYGCSLLGSDGSNATCTTIAADGATGTYGTLSFCSADIKLSCEFFYIFSFREESQLTIFSFFRSLDVYSAHYIFTNYNAQACE